VDEKAIPIAGKQEKPKQKTAPKTPQHQPPPKQQNLAQYGEQNGTSIPHATQAQAFTSGATSVTDANFGSLFGWYVGQINRKMDAAGYRSMADPRTPKGARTYIEFKIFRDGSHGDVRLDTSSGSATWDNVCVRAAQRVDTFGPLPPQYRESTLQVFYYCEY
jgi:protein TonB